MMTPPHWDLSDLFSGTDDPAIDEVFRIATSEARSLVHDYKGKVSELSADRIRDLLERYERILQLSDKPDNFAFLRYTTNVGDASREGFQRVIRERVLEIEGEIMWVKLELAQLPIEHLESLIRAPETAFYRHFLEKILLTKPHQLSESEERLIADFEQTGREAFSLLFEQEDATKVFTLNGEFRTLESLLDDHSHPDRTVRAQAAEAIAEGLGEEALRRSTIYTNIIKSKQITDRYRNYAYPEQIRHTLNETSPAAVEALAQAAEAYQGVFRRYYAWKAKRLGVLKLADYDLHAPLADIQTTYTFDEARDIILDAFAAFSPEMCDLAKEVFENGWIDAEPSIGKKSGAYCQYIAADLHPYVFLNFQGKIGDVLTLAHELGHAVHTMLARPKGDLQFTPPLTLAETASTFSELLVFDALRKKITDPNERIALQASKLEEIFSAVFQQIGFYRFEQRSHRFVRENGSATPQEYQRMWIEAAEPIFGETIEISAGYRHGWSRISHFFDREFYVYAYAFGELIACCLYEESKLHPEEFNAKYLELLRNGGSKSPKDLLAPLGLDSEEGETWKRGLEWITRLVDEMVVSE